MALRRRALAMLSGLAVVAAFASPAVAEGSPPRHDDDRDRSDRAVLFASDGMRQDAVEQYADEGAVPEMAKLLSRGAHAADDGLMTQAPPNTGAGWFTLATGAWPGVHGSTNNTFAKNGAAFGTRVSAFDDGVLQAETIAQSAERGGKKVAQVEWAGGRNGKINGPTVDFRTFSSGRGVPDFGRVIKAARDNSLTIG